MNVAEGAGSFRYSFMHVRYFTAIDRWTKKPVHLRLSGDDRGDFHGGTPTAVDIKFLVDGRRVWVPLPHPAWVEYKKRTGRAIRIRWRKKLPDIIRSRRSSR